jgi:hypothetical protein
MEIRKTPTDFIASSKQKFILSQARLKPGHLELTLLSLQGSLEDGLRAYLLLHGHRAAEHPLPDVLEVLRADAKRPLAAAEAKRVQAMSRAKSRIVQGEAVTLTYNSIEDYMHVVADILLRYDVLVVVPETRPPPSSLIEPFRQEQRAAVWWRRARGTVLVLLLLVLLAVVGAVATTAINQSSALIPAYLAPSATPEANATSPNAVSATHQGLAAGGRARVNVAEAESLAVRLRPGLAEDNPVRLYLRRNTAVRVLEGPVIVDGAEWWKVRTANQEGWCQGDYLVPQ